MTATRDAAPTALTPRRDRLHRPLVRLPRGDRRQCGEIYDLSVSPVLRLSLARVRGDQAEAEELRSFARQQLRSSRTPEQIEFWPELPYNETGKLLRRKVKAELTEGRA